MKKPLQLIQCMDSLETKWLNMKDFIVKPTQLEELLLQITALAPHNSKKKKNLFSQPWSSLLPCASNESKHLSFSFKDSWLLETGSTLIVLVFFSFLFPWLFSACKQTGMHKACRVTRKVCGKCFLLILVYMPEPSNPSTWIWTFHCLGYTEMRNYDIRVWCKTWCAFPAGGEGGGRMEWEWRK